MSFGQSALVVVKACSGSQALPTSWPMTESFIALSVIATVRESQNPGHLARKERECLWAWLTVPGPLISPTLKHVSLSGTPGITPSVPSLLLRLSLNLVNFGHGSLLWCKDISLRNMT